MEVSFSASQPSHSTVRLLNFHAVLIEAIPQPPEVVGGEASLVHGLAVPASEQPEPRHAPRTYTQWVGE